MKTKSAAKNEDRWANKEKPVIRFVENVKLFTRNGIAITDAKAREHWDALDSDWTMGAYNEMSKRALQP